MPVALDARRDAARRLYEGETATPDLIARAAGWSERTLRDLARKQGWRARRGVRPGERLAPLLERLTAQAAALGDALDGPLPTGDLTGVNAILKTIQTIRDLSGGTEAVADERRLKARENDDRLAAILARIDDRIEALAKIHAREMLRKGWTKEEQG